MPAKIVYRQPSNHPGWGYTYGWATVHTAPDGSSVYCLWTDATCPEMSPGEQRYRAIMHAEDLIRDGGVWPDQVSLRHFAGARGTYTLGHKLVATLAQEYGPEAAAPDYWEPTTELYWAAIGEMTLVGAIQVGGVWHAVEDQVTGAPLLKVGALSEQCDTCGSSGMYSRLASMPLYTCDACGAGYPISTVYDDLVVFS